MRISKQIFLITPILFIFFAPGCSKSLLHPDNGEPDFGFFREENVGEVDTSSGPDEKSDRDQNLGPAELGMSGNGSTDSVRAEPFGDVSGMGVPLSRDEVSRHLPYRSSDGLKDIPFAFNKYDLNNKVRAIMEENVAYLKSHPESKIEIQGYCDERGSNNYNLSLGQRRAQSIKSYLITLGVDESRIHTVSFGEEKPFCYESNEECWEQNRRALFLVVN